MMKTILLSLLLLCCTTAIMAQDIRKETSASAGDGEWEYEVKAGVNIGGSLPVPIPVEIRSVDSYKPRFNGAVEGVVTRWLGTRKHWGVSAGLRMEMKGMHTGATVKNYSLEIVDDDSKVAGCWTGYVDTKYSSTFLTLPVTADFRFSNRWKFRAGVFFSYLLDGEFSGYVTDGYLRQGSPVGEKISFVDGKQGTYDFSDDLRKVQTGVIIGASWLPSTHVSVNADLTWGLNDIFKSDFNTITFNMYPVYLNVAAGYKF